MSKHTFSVRVWAPLGLLVMTALLPLALPAAAQDRPPERQMRAYIPPDQLVSFRPSTPLNQFIEVVNPIFERITGKTVIDPQDRAQPIGVSVYGMQFFDALEQVLATSGLTYRETDRFFVVENAPADEAVAAGRPAAQAGGAAQQEALPATSGTREIRIDAVLFDLNLTKLREIGVDWSTLFGNEGGAGGGAGGGGGGAGGGQNGNQPQFYIRTDDIFDALGDRLTGPDRVNLSTLVRLFQVLEDEGAGRTVANPQITVQSGEEGRIQVGADIPVQTRDFAGNTVTQFFSTGIIINVTPTLIEQATADTTGAPKLGFVHMDVHVENSNSSASTAGPIIARNTADTQVLLLDGEQTIIGGLYSTGETVNRRGIPILKDLPPWFFGLRYLFGTDSKSVTRRELVIVLQAQVRAPLQARATQPYDTELIEKNRASVRRTLRRVGAEVYDATDLPKEPQQGQPSSGQPSSGQPSSGQPSSGQPSSGQPSSGQPSSRRSPQ